MHAVKFNINKTCGVLSKVKEKVLKSFKNCFIKAFYTFITNLCIVFCCHFISASNFMVMKNRLNIK